MDFLAVVLLLWLDLLRGVRRATQAGSAWFSHCVVSGGIHDCANLSIFLFMALVYWGFVLGIPAASAAGSHVMDCLCTWAGGSVSVCLRLFVCVCCLLMMFRVVLVV